jgi:hypothetical protein
MGIAGGQWRVETGVILSLSRRGRGTLIPARRRAFWPDGGPSCALLGRREAAVLAMLLQAVGVQWELPGAAGAHRELPGGWARRDQGHAL